jgi:hypothetical protein
MFGDNRTPAERERDRAAGEKLQSENLLATNLLKNVIKPMLVEREANVGLVGRGLMGRPELLFEVDGVTYKIVLSVDNEL